MIELPPLTPAQQAAGVDRIGQNTALRSGAGCGKTFVLARRFTELLLHGGDMENPLQRFVALTFTDKAALEMSQRVRGMMQAFAARAGSDADRKRLRNWLEQLPEARISTIHSFCASLLRSCAIEAGLDPDFAVCADNLVTSSLLAEAAEQAVLAAVADAAQPVGELLTSLTFERLVHLVRELVELRDRVDPAEYADPDERFNRWRRTLIESRRDAQERLAGDSRLRRTFDDLSAKRCIADGDKLLPIQQAVLAAASQVLLAPMDQAVEQWQFLANIKTGNVGADRNWGGEKGSAKAVRDAIRALSQTLQPYAAYAESFSEPDRASAEALRTLTQLADRANRRYHNLKLRRGIVDFTDLLVLSRDLLTTRPKLAAALGEGIDQLLIDEAQDTDVTQLAMLMPLLVGADSPAGKPAPGRLFLVGDAMQSIYRFRGAQLEVFRELCEKIGADSQVNLGMSFRTHTAGTEFINHVFAPLMGGDYTPIKSKRSECPPGPSVEILLADDRKGENEDSDAAAEKAHVLQARLTAQRIEEMLAGGEKRVWDSEAKTWRPARAGDIAVLFSRRTHSLEYERQLQRRNIPYYVVAGTGFFRQQEVYDVLNALRVIDNPFDDVALFGVLRSAMIGMDDNALCHIAHVASRPYLPGLFAKDGGDSLRATLDEAQYQALRFACDLLTRLGRQKDAMGLDDLIRQLLRETCYEATLMARFQGRRQLGNVRQLLEMAKPASGRISLAEFITQMDEQILSESRYEQAAVSGEGEDVVRLMTIHQSKGMEFPIVFVPDLNTAPSGTGKALLHRLDWGLTSRLVPGDDEDSKDDQPLAYRIAKQLEDDDQQRETIRKYYVALTRHEDHLVLVGANRRNKDGGFKESGCFLEMLDETLNLTAALDAGQTALPYGRYTAELRCLSPKPPKPASASAPPGRAILKSAGSGAEVGRSLCTAAAKHTQPLELIGPVPPTVGRVELAATALGEFDRCPMCHHWRYELRAPIPTESATPSDAVESATPSLDPLTRGTLLHRCMELLDFAHPQPAEVLAGQAISEMDLADAVDAGRITTQLAEILDKFGSQELARILKQADEVHRELDFVTEYGPAAITGQIDLLYRTGDDWHVVDWKSDHPTAADLPAKAERYELQLLIYADAMARHTSRLPASASLYFLPNGLTHSFEIAPQRLAEAKTRLARLADELLDARRSGKYRRCNRDSCDFCRENNLGHLGMGVDVSPAIR